MCILTKYRTFFTLVTIAVRFLPYVSAIADGHDTKINRHPWVAALLLHENLICGAGIIGQHWALTSANCIYHASTGFSIRTGSNHTDKGGQVLKVDRTIIHPQFNPRTHDSDIALLYVSANITDAKYTLSAPLPYDSEEIPYYASCNMVGWGKTGNGTYPEQIQFVQVPATTRETCREIYSVESISNNMFCGGFVGKQNMSACTGDFGGPVMVYATLEGIMSWGRSCGISRYPTVYTRVANFKDWIKEITGIGPNG